MNQIINSNYKLDFLYNKTFVKYNQLINNYYNQCFRQNDDISNPSLSLTCFCAGIFCCCHLIYMFFPPKFCSLSKFCNVYYVYSNKMSACHFSLCCAYTNSPHISTKKISIYYTRVYIHSCFIGTSKRLQATINCSAIISLRK